MPTTDLVPTSVISATGWTGATAANLASSDDVRATDGTAGEVISVEITDAPGDFGTQNSVTLKVEARTLGTVSRAKSILVELLDGANNVLQSFTTASLASADAPYTSSAFARSDNAATISGYRLRATVQEGGGMADSATVQIDRLWATLNYNVAVASATATMAAIETGSDALSGSVAVAVAASMAGQEAGADTAAGVATMGVVGTLAALEAGSDSLSAAAAVDVSASMAAVETGSDTFSGSASAAGAIGATMTAVEAGDDTASGFAAVSVAGALGAVETGADGLAATAAVEVSGSLTAQEAGADAFSGAATTTEEPTATMAAAESGQDAAYGVVLVLIQGGLAASETETGGDVMTGSLSQAHGVPGISCAWAARATGGSWRHRSAPAAAARVRTASGTWGS